MILKFIGDENTLHSMGYRYNEHGGFYTKGHPDFGLYIWKETKEISLNPFTKEITAMIYEFLKEHDFLVDDEFVRLTYNKSKQSVENFLLFEHTVIGVYGYNYSEENAKEIDDNYQVLLLEEFQVEYLDIFCKLSLIE